MENGTIYPFQRVTKKHSLLEMTELNWKFWARKIFYNTGWFILRSSKIREGKIPLLLHMPFYWIQVFSTSEGISSLFLGLFIFLPLSNPFVSIFENVHSPIFCIRSLLSFLLMVTQFIIGVIWHILTSSSWFLDQFLIVLHRLKSSLIR